MKEDLKTILLIGLVNSIMYAIVLTIIPLYAMELGAGILMIGLVAASFPASQIFLRIPLGSISDYVGRRKMLTIAFVGGIIAGAIYVYADTYHMLLLGQLIFGATIAIIWTSALAHISEMSRKGKTAGIFGLYMMFSGIGFLMGPLLGSYVAEEMGFEPAFMIFTGLSGLGLLLSLMLSKTKEKKKGKTKIFRAYRRAIKIGRDRMVSIAAGFALLSGISVGVFAAYFPPYIQGVGIIGISLGALISIRQVSWIAIRPFTGKIAQKIGPVRTLVIGATIGGLGTLIIPSLESFVQLAIVGAITGLAMGPALPIIMSLIAENTSKAERGLGYGVYGTAMTSGQFASPIILGTIASSTGDIGVTFVTAGILALVGAATIQAVVK